MLQETLLGAWRGLTGFEGRSSGARLLHRIAGQRLPERAARPQPPPRSAMMAEPPQPTRMADPVWSSPTPTCCSTAARPAPA